MTNYPFKNLDEYQDVLVDYVRKVFGVFEPLVKGIAHKVLLKRARDHARTPVQWSSEENAGFTTGKPWFYVNENYKEINVADQEADEGSVLNFYREAIRLRKSLSAVRHGNYKEYGKLSGKLYTYSREDDKEKLLIVCSFTEKVTNWRVPKEFDLSTAELLLANYDNLDGTTLKPYEARVYRWVK